MKHPEACGRLMSEVICALELVAHSWLYKSAGEKDDIFTWSLTTLSHQGLLPRQFYKCAIKLEESCYYVPKQNNLCQAALIKSVSM